MKKRRKVLAALISLLALAASIRIVYVSGFLTHKHPVRNTHVFTKKTTLPAATELKSRPAMDTKAGSTPTLTAMSPFISATLASNVGTNGQ